MFLLFWLLFFCRGLIFTFHYPLVFLWCRVASRNWCQWYKPYPPSLWEWLLLSAQFGAGCSFNVIFLLHFLGIFSWVPDLLSDLWDLCGLIMFRVNNCDHLYSVFFASLSHRPKLAQMTNYVNPKPVCSTQALYHWVFLQTTWILSLHETRVSRNAITLTKGICAIS